MKKLSQKDEKMIRSLQQKKFRKKHQLFIVEGEKLVKEAMASSHTVRWVISSMPELKLPLIGDHFNCNELQMKRISSLTSPPGVLAVVEIPFELQLEQEKLMLVLEKIQDPGNLGTIIRTADAFGIKTIVCSMDTVDWYSPKVVQATMGSIFRVKISEKELQPYLSEKAKTSVLYAAHLDGKNIYQSTVKTPAVLIMGNESHGISAEVMEIVQESVKIPISGDAESFNVSIATAILLGEFTRQLSWQ